MPFPFTPEEFLPLENWNDKSINKPYNGKQVTLTLQRQGVSYLLSIAINNKKHDKVLVFKAEDDLFGFEWSLVQGLVDNLCME